MCLGNHFFKVFFFEKVKSGYFALLGFFKPRECEKTSHQEKVRVIKKRFPEIGLFLYKGFYNFGRPFIEMMTLVFTT